jgi:HEAT repeat protein
MAKGDVKGLIKALEYRKDASVRRNATLALGEIGDASNVESLITVLKDEDENVRQTAAKVLGQIRDSKAVDPLIVVLDDSNADVRETAAEALRQIGNTHIVEPLIVALRNKSLAHRAATFLGQIGDMRAVELLITIIKDENEDKDVRQTAAKTLEQIGAQAVEPLIATLSDRSKNVRQIVAKTLATIYKTDHLDGYKGAMLKGRILSQRTKMEQHQDIPERHDDSEGTCSFGHYDHTTHHSDRTTLIEL